MLGTYASAALICAASMLVGRAVLSLAGRSEWSWLEPAVGFGAILTVTGAAGPGRRARDDARPSARCALLVASAVVAGREPYRARGALRAGLPVALVDRPPLAIPFAGQRPLGHDRGRLQQRPRPAPRLGRVAAQRLRPDARSPATRSARTASPSRSPPSPASPSGRPSSARSSRSASSPASPRSPRCASSGRRGARWPRSLVAITYLAASYFAQGAFKETAEALFVLAFAARPARPGAGCRTGRRPGRLRLPPLPGPARRRLLLLQLRRPRLAARDRSPSGG